MKQDEDEPEVIFDPEVGRLVPPPKREPAPRGLVAFLLGAVCGVVLGALIGVLLAPPGDGIPLTNAGVWGFFGGFLGFFIGGIGLALLVWYVGRARRRRPRRRA
jgi:hypothetical protein